MAGAGGRRAMPSRASAAATASGSARRRGAHHLELRQALEKLTLVALLRETVVEDGDDAGVRLCADEAAEPLAEAQHRLGQVEVAKPVATLLLGDPPPCPETGVLARERQPRDHQADERVAGEILPRPERVDAQEHRGRMAAKLLGQGGGAAVHSLRQQHDAFVLDVRADQPGHGLDLAPVGKQGEQAASGELGQTAQALGQARRLLVGLVARVDVVLEDERGLAPEVERRGEDALAHFELGGQAGLATVVGKRAGYTEGGAEQDGAAQALPETFAHDRGGRERRAGQRPGGGRGATPAAGARPAPGVLGPEDEVARRRPRGVAQQSGRGRRLDAHGDGSRSLAVLLGQGLRCC